MKFETVVSQHKSIGKIRTDTNAEIDRVTSEIDRGHGLSNYSDEVNRILKFQKSDTSNLVDKTVISDLYVKDKNDNELFFEIKTSKPNKEQCVNITRKHFWIHCQHNRGFPKTKTCYGMPYNPYGEGNKYKHNFAINYLDVGGQVLIGKSFWNFLGGDGVYEELLELFSMIGVEQKRKINDLLTMISE